jgi:NADH dehydrogenase
MHDPSRGPDVPRVVIVGGGFAGLYAARTLKKAPVSVTLLDKENYHLFQPLLYQVATAALNPSDIAYPLRAALRKQKNATVLFGKAEAIDLAKRCVRETNGEIPYDYLILATGASHSYFGHNDWAPFAPGLKTVSDALDMRRRILLAYEAAERESDPALREEWLTFVVVGGGPTGVELAGALAEIGRKTLSRDFRRIDPTSVRVVLLEGQDRILGAYTPEMSEAAVRQLKKLGADVIVNAMVTGIDDTQVAFGENVIRARTILWAAGVQASPLARSLNVELDRAGRVPVEPDLSVKGNPDVFVAGDLARIQQGEGLAPGVAPAAIQAGAHAARNVLRRVSRRDTVPFQYRDKGSLATIGRASAVAEFPRFNITGFPAWMAWLMIHIFFLIGFRNRLWVIFGWAWSYVTFQRGARLITGGSRYQALPAITAERILPDDPPDRDPIRVSQKAPNAES